MKSLVRHAPSDRHFTNGKSYDIVEEDESVYKIIKDNGRICIYTKYPDEDGHSYKTWFTLKEDNKMIIKHGQTLNIDGKEMKDNVKTHEIGKIDLFGKDIEDKTLLALSMYKCTEGTDHCIVNQDIVVFLAPTSFVESLALQDSDGYFRNEIEVPDTMKNNGLTPKEGYRNDNRDYVTSLLWEYIENYDFPSKESAFINRHDRMKELVRIPSDLYDLISEHYNLEDDNEKYKYMTTETAELVKSGQIKFVCLDHCTEWDN